MSNLLMALLALLCAIMMATVVRCPGGGITYSADGRPCIAGLYCDRP